MEIAVISVSSVVNLFFLSTCHNDSQHLTTHLRGARARHPVYADEERPARSFGGVENDREAVAGRPRGVGAGRRPRLSERQRARK